MKGTLVSWVLKKNIVTSLFVQYVHYFKYCYSGGECCRASLSEGVPCPAGEAKTENKLVDLKARITHLKQQTATAVSLQTFDDKEKKNELAYAYLMAPLFQLEKENEIVLLDQKQSFGVAHKIRCSDNSAGKVGKWGRL